MLFADFFEGRPTGDSLGLDCALPGAKIASPLERMDGI